MPVSPVCAEDSILISVPLFDKYGRFLDYDISSTVAFDGAKIEAIPASY